MNSTLIKFLSIMLICITGLSEMYAQDIHFSQYYANPLQQNPAMAGAVYGMEASMLYKDQWRAVSSPYKTFAASYDVRFETKRNQGGYLAGGINLFSDHAGDSKMGTTQANASIAYHVRLNKYNRFGGGLQLGYFQRKLDYNNLQWGDQFDGVNYNPSLPNGENYFGTNSIGKFDMGAGLSWVYNNTGGDIKVTDNHDLNFSAGIGLFHVTRPNVSINGIQDKLPMRLVAHGNGVISFEGTKLALVPGFLYQRQNKQQELYIGTLFRYLITQDSKYTGLKNASALYWGAYIRAKDAVSIKVRYEYAGWGFGLSYDINTSSLKAGSYARGGLEIALVYTASNPFIKTYGANHSRY
jgi:type IX secretion system PorP/SprF family membrane protein